MKVLFPLTAYYPSQIGGPANTIYWLAKQLVIKKIDVTVVCTNIGINEKEIELNKFHQTDHGNIYYGKGGMFNLTILYKSISQVKYHDIIHTNALFDPVGLITFFYARIFYPSKIFICSVRGAISDTALSYSPIRKKIVLFFYRLLNKNVYFHATSNEELLNIKRVLKVEKNSFYLPNYLETKNRIINLKTQKKIIFLGRIHPIKCIENLIKAISISEKFISEKFYLEVIGTYEERHLEYFLKLKKLVKTLNLEEYVLFSGHVQGKEKERKIAESYFLVLPSDSENFGNVVIEALNHGTPVIASEKTPWSILNQYQAGFFIQNDPSSLANKIDRFLKMHKHEYTEYRQNAIKLINNEFDIKLNIDKWISKYKKY